jgi:hypothetical protein
VPSDAALAFLCNVGLEDDPTASLFGHLAYGQRVLHNVPVRFSVGRLKGKRSFVFARAGYGKSNLIKYLMSQLYSSPPDVGLLIFDPEGEYALPDAHGRPGLVNVPALRDRISLYTNRRVETAYKGFVKGDVYVDFGDFPPQDIVAAFVPLEKQDMVFANLLRSLDWGAWKQLVELLAKDGFGSDEQQMAKLLGYILVTQQPSSISNQIISQGDNFFVLHLLNEGDLQTLKKHNAYFGDEILAFIRAEPIPGNCYFWSAPGQPFVLPARVRNFESVCQPSVLPVREPAAAPDPKRLGDLVARAVKAALVTNPRVWLYRVGTMLGRKESGLVAFSREYFQEAVAEMVADDPSFKLMTDGDEWLRVQLPTETEAVLERHKVRTGYAVLAGVARQVWVMPQSEIKLAKAKTVRSQVVEVVERI